MSKLLVASSALLSVLSFASASGNSATQPQQHASEALTGTLQKMIVENASVTMQLDLNGLNGSNSLVTRPVMQFDLNRLNGIGFTGKTETLQFAIAANSFFPILVFNEQLRRPEPGSMTLLPAGVNAPGYTNLPVALSASCKHFVVEKLASDQNFDFAIRDSNTGFTFFSVEGGEYDYNANAQSLGITDGRLLISKEFANALGRPSHAGSVVGKISVGAAMASSIDILIGGCRRRSSERWYNIG